MTPSTAPRLLGDLAHVGRAPVLVTGASGILGGYVLNELERSATPARALCHRHLVDDDVDAVPSDLRTGRGLRFALDGTKTVVHLASNQDPAFEMVAITRLLRAIDRYSPSTHVVFMSQVGCWESARPAARAKCDAENALQEWGGNFSILRAAPGYERIYTAIRNNGLYGGTSTMRLAPVDLSFVARVCTDTAARHTPLGAPLNIYGPETHSLHDYARLCADLEGHRGIIGPLKTPVTASAVRGDVWKCDPEAPRPSGLVTPDDVIRGGPDFAQWWERTHGPSA